MSPVRRKHTGQEGLPTCRRGPRERLPCHQCFYPFHENKWGFVVTDNASSRKSKCLLRLLLIPHYEIIIRGLPGVCQQNSCWSMSWCCSALWWLTNLIRKDQANYHFAACPGVSQLKITAFWPDVWTWLVFMSARSLGSSCESAFLEPTYFGSSISALGAYYVYYSNCNIESFKKKLGKDFLRKILEKKESVKGESWSFMKFEKHTLLKSTPYSIWHPEVLHLGVGGQRKEGFLLEMTKSSVC